MTARTPAVLPGSHYRRPVRKETGGMIADTHLAVVADEKGCDARAYVKHFSAAAPRGLFNEWFGYCIMSALGVPQPNAVMMPAPLLGTGPIQWAFVSFAPMPVNQGTPKECYDLNDAGQCRMLIDRLLSCHALGNLIAADQLCLNADRNLGNLVFTGKKTFVAIDHGELLGGSQWSRDSLLRPTEWCRSVALEVCELNDPLSPQHRNTVYASADVMAEALWERYSALREVMESGRSGDGNLALEAVWWRSLDLAQWFGQQLKLMT